MNETFAELFEESIKDSDLRSGEIAKGTVEKIDSDYVVVDAGLKSESFIPISQFYNDKGELEVAVGDEVDVALEDLDGFDPSTGEAGRTILSRERAKRAESWKRLIACYENTETVIGVIHDKVKGGFTVEVQGIRAFLPGSLVDVRPVRDSSYLEGKEIEFKIIKVDQRRNNVVVSRRAVVEQEGSVERKALLDNLEEGQEVQGVVKNLTDYGAFVDLGGVDGLLHITDMAWKRVKHPSEVVTVGDEISVVVLKFDRDRSRVSLGLKQLGLDPWAELARNHPVGSEIVGKVTNLTDYGCFVEIEDGIEGLVHVSEMDWTNKNIHPSKVVQLGDEIKVKVLDIDAERRRISLGIKQCASNPWEAFSEGHGKDEKLSGVIKSITDFGIFIGLDGGIDGLVHLSDIAWDRPGEEAIHDYKKGQEIETTILAIDPERERISLGIKQLVSDSFNDYAEAYPKGAIVTGKVTVVEAKKVTVELGDGIFANLRASEISQDRVADARDVMQVGDDVEGRIQSVDRKNRMINISIKAKEKAELDAAKKEHAEEQEAGSATLGDLLKEKMDARGTDESEE